VKTLDQLSNQHVLSCPITPTTSRVIISILSCLFAKSTEPYVILVKQNGSPGNELKSLLPAISRRPVLMHVHEESPSA
jgi:hypothetical protein